MSKKEEPGLIAIFRKAAPVSTLGRIAAGAGVPAGAYTTYLTFMHTPWFDTADGGAGVINLAPASITVILAVATAISAITAATGRNAFTALESTPIVSEGPDNNDGPR